MIVEQQLDRLYDLLPAIYRQRDAELGQPLRALLQVITEQVDVVEADIAQLYENWFIETCQDWVVPYIGDLIGHRLVQEAGMPTDVATAEGRLHDKILISRREVANTIRYRRRKGALSLLEDLAGDVAGWPARAVEFYALLAYAQWIKPLDLRLKDEDGMPFSDAWERYRQNYRRLGRGRTVDLRAGNALDLLTGKCDEMPMRLPDGEQTDVRQAQCAWPSVGAFDPIAHNVDVRRIHSNHAMGRYNIPDVGIFVWRLRAYSVSGTPPLPSNPTLNATAGYSVEEEGPHCYVFDALGHDTRLFTRPTPNATPTQGAGELNVPAPIRRRAFEQRKWVNGVEQRQASPDYYGLDKSVALWADGWNRTPAGQPIPAESILVADLTDWKYRPPKGKIAIDPERGRIVFPLNQLPRNGIRVRYHYGFSADMGGGEYNRPLPMPPDRTVTTSIATYNSDPTRFLMTYEVGEKATYALIDDALAQWSQDKPGQALIEITDSHVYNEHIAITLDQGQHLLLRAANRKRPIIRIINQKHDKPDAFSVTGAAGSRITLDGLLIAGRSVRITGDLAEVTIRHCTLVPGWALTCECEPKRPTEPSLELVNIGPASAPDVPDTPDTPTTPTVPTIPTTPQTPTVPTTPSTPNVPPVSPTPSTPPVSAGTPAILPNTPIPTRTPPAPSVALRVVIEHSILGSIVVDQDDPDREPLALRLSDSILDATATDREALSTRECCVAPTLLTILRTTVLGQTHTHAIRLAENCIFTGIVEVARRQIGCVRFCYVPPDSRTPRRYECQPDLVEAAVQEEYAGYQADLTERDLAVGRERLRVRPVFNSERYGASTYCQLSQSCALEIRQGADDESEMGAFHDLFQPQRAANLRARLDEFTPANMQAGVIYAT